MPKCGYCNGVGYIVSNAYTIFGMLQTALCPVCANNRQNASKQKYDYGQKSAAETIASFDHII